MELYYIYGRGRYRPDLGSNPNGARALHQLKRKWWRNKNKDDFSYLFYRGFYIGDRLKDLI